MSIDINGVAHIYITVQDFAALPTVLWRAAAVLRHGVPGRHRRAVLLHRRPHRHRHPRGVGRARGTPFDQYRAGLHHLCLRARSTPTSMRSARFVADLGARIVHPPQLDEWAPGYYSVLFEDPCGTRLEVNYVPGKGHLADETRGRRWTRRAAAPQRSWEAAIARGHNGQHLVTPLVEQDRALADERRVDELLQHEVGDVGARDLGVDRRGAGRTPKR